MSTSENDAFTLYDVDVVCERSDKPFVCDHKEGVVIHTESEMMSFPQGPVSMYFLGAVLPLIPMWQRPTHRNDWAGNSTETIACPDGNCGARFRLVRRGTRTINHSDVTAAPKDPNH